VSAPEPAAHGTQHPQQLLVVIDPLAPRSDGESVRIAKDVLRAGAPVKFCLPDTHEEFARALARRGHRRPVVVGNDRALVRMVTLLHRQRELSASALSLVPVGPATELVLAHSLGVPASAVAAARAVLDGVVRPLDLLVDDSDGVVLGGLRIPALPAGVTSGPWAAAGGPGGQGGAGAAGSPSASATVWHACRSLVRTLVRPAGAPQGAARPVYRLRVEVDGVVLNDLDQPVERVTVRSPGNGRAEVVVRPPDGAEPLRATARTVTVSGADFRYPADARITGPVRTRTWRLRPDAWGLTLPSPDGPSRP
jgi:hypothetical protein